MNKTTRRKFVKSAAAVAGGLCTGELCTGFASVAAGKKKSDVRIERISVSFEEVIFRTPLKFALAVVDRQTLVTVQCTVRTAAGKVATGFGTLPLNYVFTFPSQKLSADARLGVLGGDPS